MIKNNTFSFFQRVLLVLLIGLFIYQSWMLLEQFHMPSKTAQLEEQSFDHYPNIILELSSPNSTKRWSQLDNEDIKVIQDWMSSDTITSKFNKIQNGQTLKFEAPKGSKPSSLLDKLKLFPQVDISSIEVKTFENQRIFILNLIQK